MSDIAFEINKPELNTLLDLLKKCGQVVSVFLKPKPPVNLALQSKDKPLAGLLNSEGFSIACEKLGAFNTHFSSYSTLNRLEFEGSLTTLILEGGCHRMTSDLSKEMVQKIVTAGVNAAFPEQFPIEHITVWRIDDEEWCELTRESTISQTYIGFQGLRNLWWVLCIADID